MSICTAYTLTRVVKSHLVRILLICLILLIPTGFIVRSISVSNVPILFEIDYVLAHSNSGDVVYDPDNYYNVFRGDLHYFWYATTPHNDMLTPYNSITNGKYADYDPCQLILDQEPVFIAGDQLNLSSCELELFYSSTPFPKLYQRIAPEHF